MEMKYGMLRMTHEYLHLLLQLPEEVAIEFVASDHSRRLTEVVLASNDEVEGYTFTVAEGQTIPDVSFKMVEENLIEHMRKMVEKWDKENGKE